MINNHSTKIRNFETRADLEFAASLTKIEGWHSETQVELQSFFDHDPQGCLIYELDGMTAGICVATSYQNSGFIGELIVARRHRNQGIGYTLMEAAVHYLKSRNIYSIYLDGVQKAIQMYEKLGFAPICRSLRLFGQIPPGTHPEMVKMSAEDLPTIFAFDKQFFGDDRSFFLMKRWQNYPNLAWVWKQNQQIKAYLFGRIGLGGLISVGPWINLSGSSDDLALLSHFQERIGNQPFSIGILENRKTLIHALVMAGLQPKSDPPTRMITGDGANLGDNQFCYSIGSPAKG